MLFGPQRKRIHVNSLIGATGVRLVRLNPREVGPFTLREAVLAVKLELGNNNRVLSPTVHVQGGLREHESSGIRNSGSTVKVGGTNKATQRNSRGSRLLLELQVIGVVRVGGVSNRGTGKRVLATELRARIRVGRPIPVTGEV
jgi:hypothetical protein